MPAGLQVFGPGGITQIDENYQNYFLVQSLTHVTGSGGRIPVDGTKLSANALIVVLPKNFPGVAPIPGGYQNGSRWFEVRFASPTTRVALEVYVFDIVAPLAGRAFGFEVYDAAGKLVFDGSGYPLRVIDMVQIPNLSWSWNSPGGVRAGICALVGGNRTQDDGGDYESWSEYVYSTNGINWVGLPNYVTGPSGGGSYFDAGVADITGLMVDITNLPLPYLRI